MTATCMPAAASRRAVAAPIPVPPPLTRATLASMRRFSPLRADGRAASYPSRQCQAFRSRRSSRSSHWLRSRCGTPGSSCRTRPTCSPRASSSARRSAASSSSRSQPTCPRSRSPSAPHSPTTSASRSATSSAGSRSRPSSSPCWTPSAWGATTASRTASASLSLVLEAMVVIAVLVIAVMGAQLPLGAANGAARAGGRLHRRDVDRRSVAGRPGPPRAAVAGARQPARRPGEAARARAQETGRADPPAAGNTGRCRRVRRRALVTLIAGVGLEQSGEVIAGRGGDERRRLRRDDPGRRHRPARGVDRPLRRSGSPTTSSPSATSSEEMPSSPSCSCRRG